MKDPPTASQTSNEQRESQLTKQKRLKDTTPREGGKKRNDFWDIQKI